VILLLGLLLLACSPGVAWGSALQQAGSTNQVGDLPGYEAPQASPPEVVAGGRPGDARVVVSRLFQRNSTSRASPPPKDETHVDHVIPRAKGGTNDPENGQVMCRECNIKKGDKEQ
jgi:hypothetical protein